MGAAGWYVRARTLHLRQAEAYVTFLTFCKKGLVMITATVTEARENLSDLLGKVQHGHEDITIVKHGKPVAVMISAEAYAYYEALEDAELSKMVEEIHADPGYDPNDVMSHEDFWASLHAEDVQAKGAAK